MQRALTARERALFRDRTTERALIHGSMMCRAIALRAWRFLNRRKHALTDVVSAVPVREAA